MSSDSAIAVDGVSKMYRIYDRPINRLKEALWRGRRRWHREFWALQDVSFEVRRGSAFGIIGRNGAGKSTLLQIIAGTLSPTSGTVRVRGRIAALLELGSGFDMEATGRENVFMNAAILGLPRETVLRKYEDIVAFADIGDFVDQPVKTYSSGMFARLAFAVAVNLDPDILIVDEILAVGDALFQQKCVSRMRQMREKGLTLLFVSHSVDAIKSVCNDAILMEAGRGVEIGPAERVVDAYLELIRAEMNRDRGVEPAETLAPAETAALPTGVRRYGSGAVRIRSCRVLNDRLEPTRAFQFGETIVLDAEVEAQKDVDALNVSFLVRDTTGIDLLGTTTFDERVVLPTRRAGETLAVRFRFENVLRAGSYGISLAVTRVTDKKYCDTILFEQIDGVAAFEVLGRAERPVHYKVHVPCQIEVLSG